VATNKTQHKEKSINISRIEKFHPYKTILFFGLLGSTVIYLTLSFLFLTTHTNGAENNLSVLPKSFTLSTLLLMVSSYTISKAFDAFKNDSFERLFQSTILTLGLGLAFCLAQFLGIKALFDSGYFTNLPYDSVYFFALCAFNILHVLAGISLLVYLTFKAYKQSQDMVDSLLYFSDTTQLIKIDIVTYFWHYTSFSWVAIFILFLFSF
jgi:cytochrome c oxidase subunit 3